MADADVDVFVNAAAAAALPLRVMRDTFADGRAEYEHRLVLVRPDQYVVWTGDAAPADVPALFARITGRA